MVTVRSSDASLTIDELSLISGDSFEEVVTNVQKKEKIEEPVPVQVKEEIQPDDEVVFVEEVESGEEEESQDEERMCTQCNEVFSRHSLVEHKRRHDEGLICPTCGYEGSSTTSMVSHERAHLNPRSVQCILCKERAQDEKELDIHLTRHLSAATGCPWCPYAEQPVSKLKAHIDEHLRSYRIKCQFCKYYAFCEKDLTRHIEVHEERTPRKRVSLKKKVKKSLEEELNNEEETVPKDILERLKKRGVAMCSICNKKMDEVLRLEEHMLEHVKPNVAYCPHCTYRTDDTDLIVQHVLNHLRTSKVPQSASPSNISNAPKQQ